MLQCGSRHSLKQLPVHVGQTHPNRLGPCDRSRLASRFDAEVAANALCMWDSLARPGQARSHKVGYVLDGLAGFRKPPNLEHMDHTRPDFEFHGYPVRQSLLRHPDAIVAEDFVLADLNQQRRNPALVSEDG